MVKISSITFLFFLLLGCNKITPSGEFWKSYHQNEIYFEEFDHGPYGGTTKINWKKKNNFKFETKEIIRFVEENGWTFVDETDIENVITSNDFSYSIINTRLNLDQFKNAKVMRFKTNFITVNEDKQIETQNNCFAILSEHRDSLTVYYQWGDFQ